MRRVIQTAQAPSPIGPYSQGVVVPPFLYTAGQVGLDPQTGKLVPGGVQAETRQALRNLEAVVQASGGRLEDIVKTTVFLADMTEFAAFNAAYAEFFPRHPPARSTVAAAALPAGARVEIEAIAHWT
jgi:2-iminobutanoate/2-iminopropanoate deaminase